MEARAPHHHVEIFTDPTVARDMIKGILHTIFFHRLFPTIRPLTRPILSISLPAVDDVDLESIIDDRATSLVRRLQALQQPPNPNPSSYSPPTPQQREPLREAKGTLTIGFYEKRRRKAGGYGYTFFGRGFNGGEHEEEEVCWERWSVAVELLPPPDWTGGVESEVDGLRRREVKSLEAAAMEIIQLAGEYKDHIPPITTTEENPFPYEIEIAAGS